MSGENRKILVAGPFDEGALAGSYARTFESLGYEPFCFDSDSIYRNDRWFSANRFFRRLGRKLQWDNLNRYLLEVASCVRPCLIVAVKCCFIQAETVRQLRTRLGSPVINIYPDHPYCGVPLDPRNGASTLRRNLIEVLREYTAVFIWENRLVERLQGDGVNSSFLPFGVDSHLCNPQQGSVLPCFECAREHDVVFIGHYNPKRGRHIRKVSRHVVALWGSGWNRIGRPACRMHRVHHAPAYGRAVAAIYRQAAVSLNVLGDLSMPGHNMRTFEIPASGGVMLAHYTKEQAEFFPDGEAALYYRTPEELDDKIGRLRDDQAFSRRIRENALRLASNHTYAERAATVLHMVGLPA